MKLNRNHILFLFLLCQADFKESFASNFGGSGDFSNAGLKSDACVSNLTAQIDYGFLPNPNTDQYRDQDISISNAQHPFTAENGMSAYRAGYFPYFNHRTDQTSVWENPSERGILPFSKFLERITSGNPNYRADFRKALRQFSAPDAKFTISVDTAFSEVLRLCRETPHINKKGELVLTTWISPEIAAYYQEMYRLGQAHSFEVWNGDRLVAGIFGIYHAGVASGESAFHSHLKEDENAGKVAVFASLLIYKKLGIEWLDAQMVSRLTAMFGGYQIPRAEFEAKVLQAQATQAERPWTIPAGKLSFDDLVDDQFWSLLNLDKLGNPMNPSLRPSARKKASQ